MIINLTNMYTAKEINKMSIEEVESLAQGLTEKQLMEWSACGYDGDSYVNIKNSN